MRHDERRGKLTEQEPVAACAHLPHHPHFNLWTTIGDNPEPPIRACKKTRQHEPECRERTGHVNDVKDEVHAASFLLESESQWSTDMMVMMSLMSSSWVYKHKCWFN